jgi:LysR family transcriptional regulator for bpeEF and oprC
MDKLRALQYLVAAAEASSFSGAARKLGVSAAAVAKLVTALEQDLGMRLFERHAQGIALTTGGASYLEACHPALAQLADADEQARARTAQARGTVVVGVQPVIAQEWLTAALPRFAAMYPEILLDIRYFMRVTEEQVRGVDAFLVLGWPTQTGNLVQRRIGAASFVVCASPSYWAMHGMPGHPSDLEHHNCLCIRSNTGSVMDLWHFKRGDEEVSVAARGTVVVDNVHRDMVLGLSIAGAGVARISTGTSARAEIASGSLLPALTDWEMDEVPPINLLYPPSVRRIPRVRLFLDFATQLFREIEMQRENHAPATSRPGWLKSWRPRASATQRN